MASSRFVQVSDNGEMDRFLAQLQQLIGNADEIGPGLGDRFGLLPKNGV
jgi:hypothetical protein